MTRLHALLTYAVISFILLIQLDTQTGRAEKISRIFEDDSARAEADSTSVASRPMRGLKGRRKGRWKKQGLEQFLANQVVDFNAFGESLRIKRGSSKPQAADREVHVGTLQDRPGTALFVMKRGRLESISIQDPARSQSYLV